MPAVSCGWVSMAGARLTAEEMAERDKLRRETRPAATRLIRVSYVTRPHWEELPILNADSVLRCLFGCLSATSRSQHLATVASFSGYR